jgi:hypothetical protein
MTFDANVALDTLRFVRDRVVPTMEFLQRQVGGLSTPGKMPWYSYSIPAEHCKVGSTLREIAGSVCEKCYACKGRYRFPNVAEAMERRYQLILANPSTWAGHMAALLARKARDKPQHFRWHDSGDLIDQAHLDAIVWIARQLPHIKFWLPTKEYGLVRRNRAELETVPNLTVRVSAPTIGQLLPKEGLPRSSVGAGIGFLCQAQENQGKCGDCRACWDKDIPNVDYPLH